MLTETQDGDEKYLTFVSHRYSIASMCSIVLHALNENLLRRVRPQTPG